MQIYIILSFNDDGMEKCVCQRRRGKGTFTEVPLALPAIVYNFLKLAQSMTKRGDFMGFFSYLFQPFPSYDPWIEEINEKIRNAQNDDEREMYEGELNNLLMMSYRWW